MEAAINLEMSEMAPLAREGPFFWSYFRIIALEKCCEYSL